MTKEEKKQERIGEICTAALEIYEEKSFSEITLADIARKARFTRSNLYKYFTCREDLFLHLLQKDLLDWMEEVEQVFSGRHYNKKEFSHIWADILIRRKRSVELYSLSHSHWEKGASDSVLKKWNEVLSDVFHRGEDVLVGLYPGVEGDDMNEFLISSWAQASGIIALLFMSSRQNKAREEQDLSWGSSYFREIFSHALESLLSAWV